MRMPLKDVPDGGSVYLVALRLETHQPGPPAWGSDEHVSADGTQWDTYERNSASRTDISVPLIVGSLEALAGQGSGLSRPRCRTAV